MTLLQSIQTLGQAREFLQYAASIYAQPQTSNEDLKKAMEAELAALELVNQVATGLIPPVFDGAWKLSS